MYITFDLLEVRKAVIDCINRIEIIGRNILIDPDTVFLNEKCEIEFRICENKDYENFLYNNNVIISQHNFQLIIDILREYNIKRIEYWKSKNMYSHSTLDIYIYDIKFIDFIYDNYTLITDIKELIYQIQHIPIIHYKDYIYDRSY